MFCRRRESCYGLIIICFSPNDQAEASIFRKRAGNQTETLSFPSRGVAIEAGRLRKASLQDSGPGDVDEGLGDSPQRPHWAILIAGSSLEMGKLASA